MQFYGSIILFVISANFVPFVRCRLPLVNDNYYTYIVDNYTETPIFEIDVPPVKLRTMDSHSTLVAGSGVREKPYNFCTDTNVLFYLYTRRNKAIPQNLQRGCVRSLKASHFDGRKPTIFITHGFINSANSDSCTLIRDAYLAGENDVNVIVVDWSAFTYTLYNWSVEKVAEVGKLIGEMIGWLKALASLKLESTTLVGHSLGAHVMGVAGESLNGRVTQIFGLDPALPFLAGASTQRRISSKAARNVQIIHTDGDVLGLSEPLGHSDFYPNGGKSQPGCTIINLVTNDVCSHGRAFELFAESLNAKVPFRAFRCKNHEDPRTGPCSGRIETMGGRSNGIRVTGLYYLKTGNSSPYALRIVRRKRMKNRSGRSKR